MPGMRTSHFINTCTINLQILISFVYCVFRCIYCLLLFAYYLFVVCPCLFIVCSFIACLLLMKDQHIVSIVISII